MHKLNLDDLSVESFDTVAGPVNSRGTVHGHTGYDNCITGAAGAGIACTARYTCEDLSCGNTCPYTCKPTCDDPSCGTSCQHTQCVAADGCGGGGELTSPKACPVQQQ